MLDAPPIDAASVAPDAPVVVHPPRDAGTPHPPPARFVQTLVPHDSDLAMDELPEEPDEPLIRKINDQAVAYIARTCGPWPADVPVEITYRIDLAGRVDIENLRAPDAHAQKCIADVFALVVFPRSRRSFEMVEPLK